MGLNVKSALLLIITISDHFILQLERKRKISMILV